MDVRKITLILLGFIAVLTIYNVFFGSSSVRETRKIATQLKQQVDTLAMLNNKYDRLQRNYVLIYNDLKSTRAEVYSFKDKVENITKMQTHSVRTIKTELSNLIERYDSLQLVRGDSVSFAAIDSLKF